MRNFFLLVILYLMTLPVQAQSKFKTGSVDIDGDLNQINISANANFGKFRTELSLAYNITESRIDHFHSELHMEPAEIYYALEVSHVCQKPVDDVIEVYKTRRGKGWGRIAKDLGIKPGSDEFHELKERVRQRAGNQDQDDQGDSGKGKKNHGKGKGRNK